MNRNPQYDEDFYAWTLNSAKLLKYFPAKCEYSLEDCLNDDFFPKVTIQHVDGNAHFCSIFDKKSPLKCSHTVVCCAFAANFLSNLKQNWTFCVCKFLW